MCVEVFETNPFLTKKWHYCTLLCITPLLAPLYSLQPIQSIAQYISPTTHDERTYAYSRCHVYVYSQNRNGC